MLECVVNVSEGRNLDIVRSLAAAGAPYVLDTHSDPHHHRSVLTLCGPSAAVDVPGPLEEAVRAVARTAVRRIDLRAHSGVHPRTGALDVVPFVALRRDRYSRLVDGPTSSSLAARDRFGAWAGRELRLPCFLYGPERSLPDVRRGAWVTLEPDFGPTEPHPTAGATAVGARPVLVAYNLWLTEGAGVDLARDVARSVRSPGLRALGLQLGDRAQVSCNLVEPWRIGPGRAFDSVAVALEGRLGGSGGSWPSGNPVGIERAELVGLLPRAVLEAEARARWAELGLDPSTTIEARLEQAGLDGGRY